MSHRILKSRQWQELEQEGRSILLNEASGERFAQVYDDMYALLDEDVEDQTEGAGLQGFILRKVGTGKCVLEVGCGDGTLSAALARRGNAVVAMDISRIRLGWARAKYSDMLHLDLQFVLGDARRLHFEDASFDYVISENLIEHLSAADGRRHLLEAQRVLRCGGCYLFHVPNRITKGYRSSGLHLWMYSLGDMTRLVSSLGFEPSWIEPKLDRWLGIKKEIPAAWLAPVFGYERFLDAVRRVFLFGHSLKIGDHRLAPTVLIAAYKVMSGGSESLA